MRSLIVLAGLMLALGGLVARYADRMPVGHATGSAQAASPAAETDRRSLASRIPQPSNDGGRRFTARAGRNGHFRVEGRADGRAVDFLVDTGASVVTLRQSDAARVGLFPGANDFRYEMRTANGVIRAAKGEIRRLEVGDIEMRNVMVAVLPDEALSDNLLGNTFLSRLSRFQMGNGRLEMEQ